MLIRCSLLPKIMVEPKNKNEVLSETAKSELKKIALQDFLFIENNINTKYTLKGIEVENESIDLYNRVNFTNHKKNTKRLNNEFLTGECDIDDELNDEILDIKSSWSIDTFPFLEEEINIKDYEMQLRGYMMLYNRNKASVVYCLVDTPEYLIGLENEFLHKVSHIEEKLRITKKTILRDLEIEEKIKKRCLESIKFYNEYINKLNNK